MHRAGYSLPWSHGYSSVIHVSILVGIDVSFNASCAESELNKEDYLKILWAAAAELPGTCMYVLAYAASPVTSVLF